MGGSTGSCVWKPLVLNFVESGCVVHAQRRGVRNDQSSVSDSNAWRDVVREDATQRGCFEDWCSEYAGFLGGSATEGQPRCV